MDGDGGGDDAPNGKAEVKEGRNTHEGVECDQSGLKISIIIAIIHVHREHTTLIHDGGG